MRYIGIDLGLNGAIAWIDSEINEASVIDMPVYNGPKNKKYIDLKELHHQVQQIAVHHSPSLCAIEHQQPYPKQGVVSVFSLGQQFGFLKGILISEEQPFQVIKPKDWQKEYNIAGEDSKKASYAVASALFPKLQFKTERGRILDGRADAILIAEYCRRKIPFIKEEGGLVSLFG